MKDGIYVVGGFDNPDVDKFDPMTRSFKTVSSLETEQEFFGICQYDSDNFIFAGGYNVSNGKSLTATYTYNTKNSALKQVGSLNDERWAHVLVRSESGDIFAIGGSNKRRRRFISIEKFDKENQSWNVIRTRLIKGRSNLQAVAHKTYIYVIGGRLQNGSVTDSIEKFDVVTGQVQTVQKKLNVARAGFAAAKLGNLVYIMGGETSDSKKSNSVEILNLEFETIETGTNLPFEGSYFTANVL